MAMPPILAAAVGNTRSRLGLFEAGELHHPVAIANADEPAFVEALASFGAAAGAHLVIASVTDPFCGDCSRLRLSAEGSIYTCLFAHTGTDLRDAMRAGATDEDLIGIITEVWEARTDRYSEERSGVPIGLPKVEMSYIGG
mgnify:CR=1 FL=1